MVASVDKAVTTANKQIHWPGIRIALIVAGICVTTVFPLYITGYVPNTAQSVIEQFLFEAIYGSELAANSTTDYSTSMSAIWSAYVSLHSIGGTIDCLIAAPLQDRLGRRNVLLWCCIIGVPANLLQYAAKPLHVWYFLFLGRFLSQSVLGVVFVTGPVFLNEIAKIHQRGPFGFIFSFFINLAIITATLLGLTSVLGTSSYFPYLFIPSAMLCAMGIPFMWWLRESPQFLALGPRKFKDQARRSWAFFHQYQEGEGEESKLESDPSLVDETSYNMTSMFRLLSSKNLRSSIIISLTLAIAYASVTVLSSYSTSILEETGFSLDMAQLGTVICSIINAVTCLICYFPSSRLKRRTSLLPSLAFQALLWSLLIFFSWLPSTVRPIFVLLSIILIGICLSGGLQPLFFVIVPEIFPYQARSAAKGLASTVTFAGSVVFVYTFYPAFIAGMGLAYIIVAIPMWICFVILYKRCPETKGKETKQILDEMQINHPISNDESQPLLHARNHKI